MFPSTPPGLDDAREMPGDAAPTPYPEHLHHPLPEPVAHAAGPLRHRQCVRAGAAPRSRRHR